AFGRWAGTVASPTPISTWPWGGSPRRRCRSCRRGVDVVAEVLAAGRAHIEAMRRRGTCLIDREDGRTRDEYGRPVPQYVTVYEGKGYARYPGIAHEQNLVSAGADVTVSRVIYRIPLGAVVRPGDRLTITADPDNPQLEGTR